MKPLLRDVGLNGHGRWLYDRPHVPLLDESFNAVDAFTRMKLQELLSELARPRDRRSAELAYLRGEALNELYQSHAI